MWAHPLAGFSLSLRSGKSQLTVGAFRESATLPSFALGHSASSIPSTRTAAKEGGIPPTPCAAPHSQPKNPGSS